MTPDNELLREYARFGSEDALEKFLQRHVNLIYSAAMMRGGGDRDLAEEVTQQISIVIARQASRLALHPSILGWIYTSVRNAVIDVRRRQGRERERLEEIGRYLATEEDGGVKDVEKLNPFLMEELDKLDGPDRELLLLRFLGGKTHGEIATAFALPEDTVRKRSNRALAKLRRALESRGLKSGFSVLAAAAASAATTVPPGVLARALAAALGAGPASAAGLGLSLTTKKILLILFGSMAGVAGIVWLLLGAGSPGSRTPALSPAQAAVPSTVADPAQSVVAVLQASAVAGEALDDVSLLRQILARMPDHYIPELELLAEDDWRAVVRSFSPRSVDNVLPALRSLRDKGRARFAVLAVDALNRFVAANQGQLPPDALSLKPHFSSGMTEEALGRYARISSPASSGDQAIFSELKGVVDEFGDSILTFGRTLSSITIKTDNGPGIAVRRAIARYRADHGGAMPENARALADHLPEAYLNHAQENWASFTGSVSRPQPPAM